MPLAWPHELPHQRPIADLLMPFGHSHVISLFAGRLGVELTVICTEFPPGVSEIRALLLRRAGEAVTALESGGYEVHETAIRLSKPPVKCDVRVEVSERRV